MPTQVANKALRFSIRAGFYGVLLSLAFWFSYELRLMDGMGGETAVQLRSARLMQLLWVIPFKLLLIYAVGQFHGLLFYFRLPDAIRLVGALGVAGIFLFFSAKMTENTANIVPRSVALIDFNLAALAVCGGRLVLRLARERLLTQEQGGSHAEPVRVAIMGAGDAGAQLCAELFSKPVLGLRPVAFFDDDSTKHGMEVHGVPVVGGPEAMSAARKRHGFNEVIMAIPSAAVRRIRDVHTIATAEGLKMRVVPSISELASGRVRAVDLRPVAIEDLLGRDSVKLDDAGIAALIANRTVMVTGGGGSIGSEICRQVCRRAPARLIIVEQCEVLLYQIEQELVGAGFGGIVTPVVADVTDAVRIDSVMGKYKPEFVLHAAAHKHVPMMEHQPGEAVKNNSIGTYTVADAASRHGVARFTLISTDKAINPTNAMGASKRLAEILLQSLAHRPGNTTKFIAVRFGNVLGSSGSVIPLFKKQIAAGGPVTVTHPDMTRYFMTIPEAVGLVLQSTTLGEGGEIFVLDMGEPMKIVDLAKQLITLSGLRPDVDIEIKFAGLRPGEKLFEELQHAGESFADTKHSRIFRFISKPLPADELPGFLERVRVITNTEEREKAKLAIKALVPEYTPYLD
jgi:FlaA1/EpsC-like NDP-sugar epimerase